MKRKPYFSIIIPVAPDRGAEVLESIKKLDFPKSQYEVIIEQGSNPSRNRNKGAAKAKGEILCFLDDDAIVPKGLLTNAEKYFKLFEYHKLAKDYPHNNIDILGGPQLTPEDDGWFAKANGEVLASKFGSLSMSKRYRKEKEDLNADENSLTSCIMLVRAAVYKSIGGFNESLFPGEDPEFLARAKQKGFRIAYSPDIFIWHRRRPTLFGYCEQMFSYGKVRLDKEKSAKSDGNKGLLFYIPMAFVLYILFLSIFSPNLNIVYITPLIVYAFLAVLATAWIGWSSRFEKPLYYLILLPCIFFITHFMYGAGMLEGFCSKCFSK